MKGISEFDYKWHESREALGTYERLAELTVADIPWVSALIIETESGRRTGSRMVMPLTEDPERRRGDPFIYDCIMKARRAYYEEEPVLEEYNYRGERISVFFEPFSRRKRLIILGAGHISRVLSLTASLAGFRVTVMDDREEFVRPEYFPHADELMLEDFRTGIRKIESDGDSYWVVATRGHQSDEECLEECMLKDIYAYIGLLSSRNKGIKIRERLESRGIPKEKTAELHSPIGLEIGSQTPEEIAVSITAELIRERSSRRRKYGNQKKIKTGKE